MINYLLILFFLLSIAVVVDIYFHLKHKSVLEHILVTNTYYEKILLLKQIISLDDVAYTREKIKNNIGDRRYKKVKNLFLHYDDDYLNYVKDLGELNDADKMLDFDNKKKELGDMVYRKDYAKAAQYLAELYKEKVLNKNGHQKREK